MLISVYASKASHRLTAKAWYLTFALLSEGFISKKRPLMKKEAPLRMQGAKKTSNKKRGTPKNTRG
jgi:hypothetical protein